MLIFIASLLAILIYIFGEICSGLYLFSEGTIQGSPIGLGAPCSYTQFVYRTFVMIFWPILLPFLVCKFVYMVVAQIHLEMRDWA